MKPICLALLVLAGTLTGVNGQTNRTDLNPATLYYQAFLATPDLDSAERDYLFNTYWRGQELPERAGGLLARYDDQFKLVRRAAQATTPCDWGIDMSDGAATRLPHLARAKAVATTARLRISWHLQQGDQTEACDELLAALALGRNLSRDGMFISVLVQIAIEAILCNVVAENFGRFSQEMMERLAAGFEAPPARGTVVACIPSEKAIFHDWMVNKIQELRKAHPGDDAKVMEEGIRTVFPGFGGGRVPGATNVWERVSQVAGGTSEGLIQLLRDRERYYERVAVLLALPYQEFQARREESAAEFAKSPNPFSSGAGVNHLTARGKEFRVQVYLAMVRAALEYKLRGEAGFKSVSDPCGQGPFAFRRFVFEGVDRGFELKSGFDINGEKAVYIFVETEGPLFYLDGPRVGQAVSHRTPTEEFERRYGITPAK